MTYEQCYRQLKQTMEGWCDRGVPNGEMSVVLLSALAHLLRPSYEGATDGEVCHAILDAVRGLCDRWLSQVEIT